MNTNKRETESDDPRFLQVKKTFFARCCNNKREGISSQANATAFLRSALDEIMTAIDIIDSLEKENGFTSLKNCLNLLDYDSPESSILLSKFMLKISKHQFVGLRKKFILEIYETMANFRGFLGMLVQKVLPNLASNSNYMLIFAWFVSQLIINFENFKTDINIQRIQTRIIQYSRPLGNEDEVKRLFSGMESRSYYSFSELEIKHDNDFPKDFRKIQIIPTSQELNNPEAHLIYTQRGWRGNPEAYDAQILDRQFRLLRDDMLSPLFDEISAIKKNSSRSNKYVNPVALTYLIDEKGFKMDGFLNISIAVPNNIKETLNKKISKSGNKEKSLVKLLNDDFSRVLKLQSVLLFFDSSNNVVALGTIFLREEIMMAKEFLANNRFQIGIQASGDSLKYFLQYMQGGEYDRRFSKPFCEYAIQTNVGFFSHMPVLEVLKGMTLIPLKEEIVQPTPESKCISDYKHLLNAEIETRRELCRVDKSQQLAFDSALTNRVSIIQGPPGTGKTYLGVLIVSSLLRQPRKSKILCICYTNHALDSFLESLLDKGISSDKMVRLGSKAKISERIAKECIKESLSSFNSSQKSRFGQYKDCLKDTRRQIQEYTREVATSFDYFTSRKWKQVKYLFEKDLIDNGSMYLKQLKPKSLNFIGKDGNNIKEDYFWREWIDGLPKPKNFQDIFNLTSVSLQTDIWSLSKDNRKNLSKEWFQIYKRHILEELQQQLELYTKELTTYNNLRDESKLQELQNADIVACTTIYAAKNKHLLDSCNFDTILVEEAAEILEAHILVNLSESTKRLIMIGDHQQLRPKLDCYQLRKESNQNINFDISLFERLVTNKYPVTTLQVQHRMKPIISQFIRENTYPELKDYIKTHQRESIKGTFTDLAFIDHHQLEKSGDETFSESRSKINMFEIQMVMKMIQHFLFHGYSSTDIVVLTPYLGQLSEFRKEFKKHSFGIEISELDQEELETNKLLDDDEINKSKDERVVDVSKPKIRVSTIDNFQGEESNIIIASLVRSNAEGNIGFMGTDERVNVLFSRARNGFYVIGNSQTFMNCKNTSAKSLWTKIINRFQSNQSFFDGFPAFCINHNKKLLIKSPEEFNQKSPNGGCDEICSEILACGHPCNEKCHGTTNIGALQQIHKNKKCRETVLSKCKNHLHQNECICCEKDKFICKQSVTYTLCELGHKIQLPCNKAYRKETCKECIQLENEKKKLQEENDKKIQASLEQSAKIEKEKLQKLEEVRVKEFQFQELMKQKILKAETEELQKKEQMINENIEKSKSQKELPMKNTPVIDSNTNDKSFVSFISARKTPPPPLSTSKDIMEPPKPSNQPIQPIQPIQSQKQPDQTNETNSNIPSKDFISSKVIPQNKPIDLSIIKGLIHNQKWFEAFDQLKVLDSELLEVNNYATWNLKSKHPLLLLYSLLISYHVTEDVESIKEPYMLVETNLTKLIPSEPPAGLCLEIIYYLSELTFLIQLYSRSVKFCKLFNDQLLTEKEEIKNIFPVNNWIKQIQERNNQAIQFMMHPTPSQPTRKLSPQDELLNDWEKIKREWKKNNHNKDSPSSAIDDLLKMIGLTSVKQNMIDLYHKFHIGTKQQMVFEDSNFNLRFEGNPGTGKTTVANLVSQFFIDLQILSEESEIIKITGSELANKGINHLEGILEELKEKKGGVIFVDEAYQLMNGAKGKEILDFILVHSEKLGGKYGKIVWIFAGYIKQMEELFGYNPGLPSRFPYKFAFEDYTDKELLFILEGFLQRGGRDVVTKKEKKPKEEAQTASLLMTRNNNNNYSYNNSYYNSYSRSDETDQWGNIWTWNNVQNTFEDKYGNITGYGARNLGTQNNPLVSRKNNVFWIYDNRRNLWYNRDKPTSTTKTYPGKPEVHEIKPIIPFKITDKKYLKMAANRLAQLRGTNGFGNARAVRNLFDNAHNRMISRLKNTPHADMHLFERDDFLGPKANKETLTNNSHWRDLMKMEGLKLVKESIEALVDLVVDNVDREEKGKTLQKVALNRVFLGNPGTGKTTVANLYAKILSSLGLLSKGEVIYKKASDFVGSALGRSEELTRNILEEAKGSVLVIDEAYGLYQNVNGGNDLYKEAVINTLVENIQGTPGEDRAVILLGYREEMENMLRHANPGLQRRFNLENAFKFEDYDDEALFKMLLKRVSGEDLKISTDHAMFAIKRLAKARAGPHFGNAGEVNNLLSNAIIRMQVRNKKLRANGANYDPDLLIKEDFVPDDYKEESEDPNTLLASLIGCNEIKEKLQSYVSIVEYNKSKGLNPKTDVHFNFLFVGAPGTGKTTVARQMGKMFSSLGLIPTDEVKEMSASDFVTGFVGQAGKATREIFQQAKGKVLFIDEAYQLDPSKGGMYMSEVVDEIVKLLTSEEFKDKLIVILAGYESDIDKMLKVNQGLRSRFQERVAFVNLTADDILRIIRSKLHKELDTTISSKDILQIAQKMIQLPQFSNGRDVETFIKKAQGIMKANYSKTKVDYITLEYLNNAYIELTKLKTDKSSESSSSSEPLSFPPQKVQSSFSHHIPTKCTTTFEVKKNIEQKADQDYDIEEVEEEKELIQKTEKITLTHQKKFFDDIPQEFTRKLQEILDKYGLNSQEKIKTLMAMDVNANPLKGILENLARDLNYTPEEIKNIWKKWKNGQKNVFDELEKVELAKKTKQKVLVPIWRCGVCGRADQPFIACYVAPFIVRYEEREFN